MTPRIKSYKRLAASLGLAAVLATAVAAPAIAADDEVIFGITSGGSLSASYAEMTIPSVNYSHDLYVTDSQDMTLTVNDPRGTGEGWNVTVQSSDFVYTGDNDGTDIPASNFTIGTPGTPASTAGQAVSATPGEGPEAVGTGGTLDAPIKVISAAAGFGQGTYTQTVGATLEVPAQSRVGTYTGTLTTTVTTGP